MATLTERLALLVSADVQGAVRGLSQVGAASKKHLGETEKLLGLTSQQLSRVGAGMLTFAAGATVGFYKAGQAAAELSSATGALNAVFGDAAAGVRKFTDEATELGLSQTGAAQLATKLGGGLKALGFTAADAGGEVRKLTERAADMAVGLGTTEQALDAIAALLRGERDPIEQFGVAIKQVDVDARAAALGLDTSSASAKKNADAIAALDLLYEQTADRAGLFSSEANAAARAQQQFSAELENAAAALGEAVLPALTSIIGGVTDAVGAFNDLPKPVQSLVSKLALFGTVGIGAAGAVATIASKFLTLNEQLRVGQGELTRTTTLLKGLATASIAAGLVAIGAAAKDMINSLQGDTGADIGKLKSDLLDFARSGNVTGELADVVGKDFGRLSEAIERVAAPSNLTKLANLQEGITSFGGILSDTNLGDDKAAIDEFDRALAQVATVSLPDAEAALRALAATLSPERYAQLLPLLDDYADVLEGVEVQARTTGTAVERFGVEMQAVADRFKGKGLLGSGISNFFSGVAGAAGAFAEETKSAIGSIDDGLDFSVIFDAIDAMDSGTKVAEGASASTRALVSARREAADAAAEVRAAEVELAAAYMGTFDATEAARKGVEDYLSAQRAAIDPLFNFVEALEQQDELLKQGSRAKFDSKGNVVGFEEAASALDLADAALTAEDAAVRLAAALQAGTISAADAKATFARLSRSGIKIPPDDLAELNKIIDEAVGLATELGGETATLASTQGVQAEQAEKVKDAEERLKEANERLADAQDRVNDSASDVASTFGNSIRTVADVERAFDGLNQELANNPALFEQAKRKLAEWVEDGKIKAEEAAEFVKKINALKIQLGIEPINFDLQGILNDQLLNLQLSPLTAKFGDAFEAAWRDGFDSWIRNATTTQDVLGLIGVADALGPGLTTRKTGGPVPGSPGEAVPILAHGGEFVLSADVVDRIRRGAQTLGADTGTGIATASSSSGGNVYQITVNNPVAATAEDSVRRELDRMAYLSGAR